MSIDSVGGPHLLVVDDNEVNLKLAVRQAHAIGVAVETARDLETALAAAFADPRPGLILMDHHLARESGPDAARAIRAEERDRRMDPIPIVAITASDHPAVRTESAEAGMNDHLTKPVSIETLRTTVERWMDVTAHEQDIAVVEDDLRDLYGQQLPERIATILQAVQDDDADALSAAAHTLRGVSDLVGATEIATLTRLLETRGREGNMEGVGDLAQALATSARAFQRRNEEPASGQR